MSEMMVGRKVSLHVDKKENHPTKNVLEVRNVGLSGGKNQSKKLLTDISFEVRDSEIVCIAGVDGNGQSQLIDVIYGTQRPSEGEIYLNAEAITHESIRSRTLSRVSYVPQDRQREGLIVDYTLEENLILKSYFSKDYKSRWGLNKAAIRDHASAMIDDYDIRSGNGPATLVRSMSGGNQQKAVIGREIELGPDLLIAYQPTRGLDVGAIEYVYQKILEQRSNGKAILLVSLELDEVFELSDRILVMYEGAITGSFNARDVDAAMLGLYMSGHKRQEGGGR
jgi:simple sugar transport system ATP-binding protein